MTFYIISWYYCSWSAIESVVKKFYWNLYQLMDSWILVANDLLLIKLDLLHVSMANKAECLKSVIYSACRGYIRIDYTDVVKSLDMAFISLWALLKKKLSNIFLKYTTNHIINSSRYAQVYNPRISHEEFPCKFNPRGTQSKHK